MLQDASCNGKWQMEDGKTPVFSCRFPFTIFHVPFTLTFFSGLKVGQRPLLRT
jgi:hypothetical protein